MKNYLLIILTAAILGAWISLSQPFFFTKHIAPFIAPEKEEATLSNSPTYFNRIKLAQYSSIKLDTGFSEHQLGFYNETFYLDIHMSDKPNAPVIIVVPAIADLESLEVYQSHLKRAESDIFHDMTTIVINYSKADELVWAEGVRRVLEVVEMIEGTNPGQIALMGYGEGSIIASYVANQDRDRVSAMVMSDLFLAPDAKPEDFKNFPPVLFFAGSEQTNLEPMERLISWLDFYDVGYQISLRELNENELHSVEGRSDWELMGAFFRQEFAALPQKPTVEKDDSVHRRTGRLEKLILIDDEEVIGEIRKETGKSYLIHQLNKVYRTIDKSMVGERVPYEAEDVVEDSDGVR